mmetsp:Transcript_37883/g.107030  ORF Transcript_37883/g.107030 Transcript_37883/m.107030 type:complete len:100 (-) Transcript_37883:1153-1452(-)
MNICDGNTWGTAKACRAVDVHSVATLEQRMKPCHGSRQTIPETACIKIDNGAANDPDVSKPVALLLNFPKVYVKLLPVLSKAQSLVSAACQQQMLEITP